MENKMTRHSYSKTGNVFHTKILQRGREEAWTHRFCCLSQVLFCIAQAGPELLGSNDPLTSVFGVAGTIGTCHFVYIFKQLLQGIWKMNNQEKGGGEEIQVTDTWKTTQTIRRPHHISCKVMMSIWNTKNPLNRAEGSLADTGILEKPCHYLLSFKVHICHVMTQVVQLQIYNWQKCVGL